MKAGEIYDIFCWKLVRKNQSCLTSVRGRSPLLPLPWIEPPLWITVCEPTSPHSRHLPLFLCRVLFIYNPHAPQRRRQSSFAGDRSPETSPENILSPLSAPARPRQTCKGSVWQGWLPGPAGSTRVRCLLWANPAWQWPQLSTEPQLHAQSWFRGSSGSTLYTGLSTDGTDRQTDGIVNAVRVRRGVAWLRFDNTRPANGEAAASAAAAAVSVKLVARRQTVWFRSSTTSIRPSGYSSAYGARR